MEREGGAGGSEWRATGGDPRSVGEHGLPQPGEDATSMWGRGLWRKCVCKVCGHGGARNVALAGGGDWRKKCTLGCREKNMQEPLDEGRRSRRGAQGAARDAAKARRGALAWREACVRGWRMSGAQRAHGAGWRASEGGGVRGRVRDARVGVVGQGGA